MRAFQLQQAPAASGRGPAPFGSAAFLTLPALCYLPRLPRTSSHTRCPNLLSRFSLQLPCSLSSTFLRSGQNLPLSLCLLPASSHVL